MAKKVTLETIHKMLSDAKDECDKLYEDNLQKQFDAKTYDENVWARCDKERFGWISEALCDIIYRIEDWQSI